MAKKKVSYDYAYELLESLTYTRLLLCIASGRNYATAIARHLRKSQSTVTEQLKELEKSGLITPYEREKALKYAINWDMLTDITYDIVKRILREREEYLRKKDVEKIREQGIQNIVSKKLLKDFLKEYYNTLLAVGGRVKNFYELIFSLFSAITKLEEEVLKNLAAKYDVEKDVLLTLSEIIAYEIDSIEQVALATLVER